MILFVRSIDGDLRAVRKDYQECVHSRIQASRPILPGNVSKI
jgi:hypothetical protein